MKKLKIFIIALLAIVIIVAPFVSVFAVAVSLPPQFDNSFVGALPEKCERLYSLDEPKIVIVGGSSVAFGIDSALIEKYTGMPVVNFGMYAALGTKLMLDLSRDAIGEGDVVILAPELDAQTLSLYFNKETTLRAIDGSFDILRHVPEENIFQLLSGMWKLAIDKVKYMNTEKPNPAGVYNSKNFNGYGDVVYPRPENTMPLYYDPNTLINIDTSIISPDFVAYLNEYIEHCESRGATVAYSFCPMNKFAVCNSDEKSREEFSKELGSLINCEIISDVEKYIYEPGYFYDTNFHLNDAGVRCHTVNLIWDILALLGIPTFVDEEVPEAPVLPYFDVKFDGEDENAKYFTYEQFPDGTYKITGISDNAKNMTELTVPLGYNGYKIVSIGAGAFSRSSVEKLVLTEDTNIRVLESGTFNGASTLSELWIYYITESDILPPVDFVGVASDFEVHIPENSDYDIGYFWSERGLTFVKDAN